MLAISMLITAAPISSPAPVTLGGACNTTCIMDVCTALCVKSPTGACPEPAYKNCIDKCCNEPTPSPSPSPAPGGVALNWAVGSHSNLSPENYKSSQSGTGKNAVTVYDKEGACAAIGSDHAHPATDIDKAAATCFIDFSVQNQQLLQHSGNELVVSANVDFSTITPYDNYGDKSTLNANFYLSGYYDASSAAVVDTAGANFYAADANTLPNSPGDCGGDQHCQASCMGPGEARNVPEIDLFESGSSNLFDDDTTLRGLPTHIQLSTHGHDKPANCAPAPLIGGHEACTITTNGASTTCTAGPGAGVGPTKNWWDCTFVIGLGDQRYSVCSNASSTPPGCNLNFGGYNYNALKTTTGESYLGLDVTKVFKLTYTLSKDRFMLQAEQEGVKSTVNVPSNGIINFNAFKNFLPSVGVNNHFWSGQNQQGVPPSKYINSEGYKSFTLSEMDFGSSTVVNDKFTLAYHYSMSECNTAARSLPIATRE